MSGRRKILAALISVLAAVALGVSAYLTWATWQPGTVAGCTAESLFDCDEVLRSRWSKWLGLPVSLLGACTYLALLSLSWPAAIRPQSIAMGGLFALALVAAGAAVWFVGLQVIQLQSFCLYCLTVHTCGLLIALLAFLLFTDTSSRDADDQMRSLLGVATAQPNDDILDATSDLSGLRLLAALMFSAAGLSALMGGQLLSKPSETMLIEEFNAHSLANQQALANQPLETPASEALTSDDLAAGAEQEPSTSATANDPTTDDLAWLEITDANASEPVAFIEDSPQTIGSLLGSGASLGKFPVLPEGVDVTLMPMLGSPQAEHVIVELMDYTCAHCRQLHPHMRAAIERYGGQLSVVIHHVPLSKKCNPNVLKSHTGKKYACDYAQLAIGVWDLAPNKFSDFHDWLLESEKPPNITKARNRALRLVGADIFDTKIKADISERLTKQTLTLKLLTGGLPVMLFTDGLIRGVPDRNETLFNYLESNLGVQPQSATN